MGIENDTHIYCWLLAIGFLLGVMGVMGVIGILGSLRSLRRLGTFFQFLVRSREMRCRLRLITRNKNWNLSR